MGHPLSDAAATTQPATTQVPAATQAPAAPPSATVQPPPWAVQDEGPANPQPLVPPQPPAAQQPFASAPQPPASPPLLTAPRPLGGTPPATGPAPSPPPLLPNATLPPVSGTAALALGPVPDLPPHPLPEGPRQLTGGELVVVHSSGGGSMRAGKFRAFVTLAVIVGAIAGYKSFDIFLRNNTKEVVDSVARDLKLPGARQGSGVSKPAATPPLYRIFTQGEQHSYRVALNMDTTVTAPNGRSQDMRIEADISFTERVVSRDPSGVTTLRYTFDRASLTAAGRSLSLPLAQSGMEVRVGPDGKRLKESTFGSGVDQLPDDGFFELLLPVLPHNPKVGSAWSRTDTVDLARLGKSLSATSQYKIVSLSGGKAVVRSSAKLPFSFRLDPDALGELGPALAAQGTTVEIEGEMEASGDQVVDVKTGRTLSGTGTGTMSATFLADGKEALQMTMRLDMKVGPEGRVSPSAV